MAKRGRKSLTTDRLVERGIWTPDWRNKIIELGKQGKTKTHIMEEMMIARKSFYRLYDSDEEFRHTVNRAMVLSQNWWINIAQERWLNGKEKNINSNHWSLMMRNMFKEDWSDRKEMDVTTQGEKLKDSDIVVKVIPPKDIDGDSDD